MGEGTTLTREGSTLMPHSIMMTLSVVEGHSYTKKLWAKKSLLKKRKSILNLSMTRRMFYFYFEKDL